MKRMCRRDDAGIRDFLVVQNGAAAGQPRHGRQRLQSWRHLVRRTLKISESHRRFTPAIDSHDAPIAGKTGFQQGRIDSHIMTSVCRCVVDNHIDDIRDDCLANDVFGRHLDIVPLWTHVRGFGIHTIVSSPRSTSREPVFSRRQLHPDDKPPWNAELLAPPWHLLHRWSAARGRTR